MLHKQWFPVVPNSYLDEDLLLGTDDLSRAPLLGMETKIS